MPDPFRTSDSRNPPLLPGWLVVASLVVEGEPGQVSMARLFVADMIGSAHPRADDVVLLASELVTNAIVHSRSGLPGGTVSVVVARNIYGVSVLVTDDGSADCRPRVSTSPGETNGNGLVLVQALADHWGYRQEVTYTTVWFAVRSPAAPRPRSVIRACAPARRHAAFAMTS
jgi:anti-sigma regulatory factor (Ser/Thr protein kinase)